MSELNKENNYKNAISVHVEKEVVFRALTEEMDKWWSENEGSYNTMGDIFKVTFGKESYWKFK